MNSKSRKIWRWTVASLTLLLALAILASLVPAGTATAAKPILCKKTYDVKRGDTLKKIGEKVGYSPEQIVYVNRWKVPYAIYVGQRICIPTSTINKPPKMLPTYKTRPAAYFTASRTADEISVYTYNYPRVNVVVNVDNAGDAVKNLIAVGSFRIGNGRTWYFKLPNDLKNASKLTICLKNQRDSYLQCLLPSSGS